MVVAEVSGSGVMLLGGIMVSCTDVLMCLFNLIWIGFLGRDQICPFIPFPVRGRVRMLGTTSWGAIG